MLGLLYWLRSCEMDEEAQALRVRPVEPLRFGFLESLSLDQAFTLKSLLEHASLTVEEHAEVFLVPVARSTGIFQMLAKLLLIEPLQVPSEARRGEQSGSSRFAFAAVESGIRYRIRPLLIQPIIQYLRGRNILH